MLYVPKELQYSTNKLTLATNSLNEKQHRVWELNQETPCDDIKRHYYNTEQLQRSNNVLVPQLLVYIQRILLLLDYYNVQIS